MKNTLIPYAMVNNIVRHIEEITAADEAICLECGETLLLRNGEKNIKHLAHRPDSNCIFRNDKNNMGTGESYEHKYAKHFIKDNLIFFREYNNQIIVKDGEFKLDGQKDLKIDSIELEYRGLKNELNLTRDYIPDILIRAEGKLIALEIYKSNKKDVPELRELLKGKNIAVYEVDINSMNNISIAKIFNNMKLIYSDLKEEFDAAMNTIQDTTIERNYFKSEKMKLEIENRDLTNKVKMQNSRIAVLNCELNQKIANEDKDLLKEIEAKNERISFLEDIFNRNAKRFKQLNDEIEDYKDQIRILTNK